jgi:hypothetical protein
LLIKYSVVSNQVRETVQSGVFEPAVAHSTITMYVTVEPASIVLLNPFLLFAAFKTIPVLVLSVNVAHTHNSLSSDIEFL